MRLNVFRENKIISENQDEIFETVKGNFFDLLKDMTNKEFFISEDSTRVKNIFRENVLASYEFAVNIKIPSTLSAREILHIGKNIQGPYFIERGVLTIYDYRDVLTYNLLDNNIKAFLK